MSLFQLQLSTTQLRRVLALDALSGAAAALLHLAMPAALSAWFGLSPTLVAVSGAVLLLYVALAGLLARQAVPARAPLMVLILGNIAWAVACLVLAWGGGSAVTPLGQAYLTVLAVAVLVLADLEFLGWIRPARLAQA